MCTELGQECGQENTNLNLLTIHHDAAHLQGIGTLILHFKEQSTIHLSQFLQVSREEIASQIGYDHRCTRVVKI